MNHFYASEFLGVTKLSSTSPFFPRAKTGVGRRSFCGTVDDLRAEVLKVRSLVNVTFYSGRQTKNEK